MTIARLTHFGGLVCVGGALLMAASDLVGVTLDASEPATTTISAPRTAFTVLRLVGRVLLLLGLVALYRHQSVAAGRRGLAGFLVPFAASAVLLILGAALGFQIGFPPYGLVLAVAVGVLGVLSYRLAGLASQSGPTDIPTRRQVVVELNTLRPTGSRSRRAG
jgi:hypothetical protein